MLKLIDLARMGEVARKRQAISVCDNTFMTPYFQRPLELGFDVVMHSTTKYLNGHSDCIGGFVGTSDQALSERMYFLQNAVGGVPSPVDSFLVLRGVKTLHVRMQRHQENALKVAEFLQKHPKVKSVTYPGLPSHPQYELARRQMSAGGTVVAFDIEGDKEACFRFLDSLQLVDISNNLGDSKSLVTHPATTTHSRLKPEERAALGIGDALVRLSAGLEGEADLLADLERALAQA
jgi:cystathionine gamma-lyase